jgi:DNA-directed RNA polymerase subunit M/transcription elongation factor TFIIS
MENFNLIHRQVTNTDYRAAARKKLTSNEDSVVSIGIKCPKCKKKDNITYRFYAARSADEGMVSLCQCLDCGYNFKL